MTSAESCLNFWLNLGSIFEGNSPTSPALVTVIPLTWRNQGGISCAACSRIQWMCGNWGLPPRWAYPTGDNKNEEYVFGHFLWGYSPTGGSPCAFPGSHRIPYTFVLTLPIGFIVDALLLKERKRQGLPSGTLTMENHHAIKGYINYKLLFSIAFCMFTRGYIHQYPSIILLSSL